MVAKPAIVWKGAHPANFEPGRGGLALEGVVIHVMEGTMAGCIAWFNDPAAQASTHYAVGKDGGIVQFVQLADAPYGHGAVEVGYEQAPALLRENWGLNPNRWLVGIEHEGWSGEAMTAAQFDASTRLTAWLFAEVFAKGTATDVAADRGHILRHGEISPRSRARCPGYPEETLTRYVARVRELLVGSATRPPDQAERLRAYEDALTMQAAALDEIALRVTLQAKHLRALVKGG